MRKKIKKISLVSLLAVLNFINIQTINNNLVNMGLRVVNASPNISLANLPIDITGHNTISINGSIYLIGGEDEFGKSSNLVYMYDKEKNCWIEKTKMLTARSYFSTEVYGDYIYCIGGFQDGNYLNSVEIYDTVNDMWVTKTSMPTSRARLSTGIIDGNIYCIGGETEAGNTGIVEVYNIESGEWEVRASLKYQLSNSSSVTINDKIYVFGGNDKHKDYNTVNIYDSKLDSWSEGAAMLTSRNSFSSIAIDNKVYCFGGLSDSKLLNTIEMYDIANNTWEIKTPMPTALHSFSLSCLNGIIYIIGGSNNSFSAISDIIFMNADDISQKIVNSNSSNIDVYIIPQNILSMSLSTNNISFEDFDGVEDMELRSAIDLHIESTLPYDLYSSLESPISNTDGTSYIDNSILSIKESSESNYQIYHDIKTPILLKGDNSAGDNTHYIDIKLNKNILYKADVYKTSIKFEAIQK